jgi:hypothetical protein
MNEWKWVRSALRHLRENLKTKGHLVSSKNLGHLLKKMDYSLQYEVKVVDAFV